MMSSLLLAWVFATSTASGQAACVDDSCQEGIRTNSLLQSAGEKTKLEAVALEDYSALSGEGVEQLDGDNTNATGEYHIYTGSGSCGDNMITDENECRNAASILGMNGPKGCCSPFYSPGCTPMSDRCPKSAVITRMPTDRPLGCWWQQSHGYRFQAASPSWESGSWTGDWEWNCDRGARSPDIQCICKGAAPTPAPPTVAPTTAPTETPTEADEFHATKITEHGSYRSQFTSDCEPCIVAEKYAADNATECVQKHMDAQQDAVSMAAADEALAACEKAKLSAEAAAASAKADITLKLAEVASATAEDDAPKAKEGADALCTGLVDAWIAKTDAVVPCDDKAAKLAQTKASYEASGEAARACDGRFQAAKDAAALACANLGDAGESDMAN